MGDNCVGGQFGPISTWDTSCVTDMSRVARCTQSIILSLESTDSMKAHVGVLVDRLRQHQSETTSVSLTLLLSQHSIAQPISTEIWSTGTQAPWWAWTAVRCPTVPAELLVGLDFGCVSDARCPRCLSRSQCSIEV